MSLTAAAVVVVVVAAAAAAAVDDEDGIQWRWRGGGVQWRLQRLTVTATMKLTSAVAGSDNGH